MEVFIFVLVGWVFSVCLHEFGHAVVAYQFGDYTVKEKGYLTLNPLHYTEPIFSLLLPVVFMMLGGIGLPGGAVYIERDRLRSRTWETCVSLGGPAMNVVLIVIISLLFKFEVVANDPQSVASVSLGFLMQLQVSALILNLIPVPPLDGFQAIAPWVPPAVRDSMYAASNWTMFALFGVLWFMPLARNIFWFTVYAISQLAGVDMNVGFAGYEAFRFWDRTSS